MYYKVRVINAQKSDMGDVSTCVRYYNVGIGIWYGDSGFDNIVMM